MLIVAGIGDVHVARPVHRHARGVGQSSLDRRSAVPAEAVLWPVPAMVVIVPVESTLRMRVLSVSAM